jgi:putative phage-type endonuclease
MSGANKFDALPAGFNKHRSMFSSISEVISWADLEMPAPSYQNTFPVWKEGTEEMVDLILETGELQLASEEMEGVEAARQIGFGVLEKFLQKAKAVGWSSQSPEIRRAEVERILSLPQIPQRTPEWYAQGKSVLTASEFGTLFGSPRAVRQLAFQKATPPSSQNNRLACMTCEMGPFDWGIRFEPVVKQILESEWGAKIVDSGRLTHPTDPLLAASPDGILLDARDPSRIGRLLEIKCPISREVGETIPFEYWCQMQIQMEVTGIEECEYVEVKIDSISPKKLDLSGAEPQGYVWLFQDVSSCQMHYAYTESERGVAEQKGWDLMEKIPWRLGKFFSKTVVRDKSWFQGTAQMRSEFWAIVEQARKGEIQPFEVKSRAKVVVTKEECRIVDDIV